MNIYIQNGNMLMGFDTDTSTVDAIRNSVGCDYLWLIEKDGILLTGENSKVELKQGDLLLKIYGDYSQKYFVISSEDLKNIIIDKKNQILKDNELDCIKTQTGESCGDMQCDCESIG